MQNTYYLDNAATTPLVEPVRQAMIKAMDIFGNPSSTHAVGVEARKAVEKARKQVADMIGASEDEIIFTSGATEANNMVVNHLYRLYGEKKVSLSAVEHPSVFEAFHYTFNDWPPFIQVLPDGSLRDERDYAPSATSIMLANNETGLIHDIPGIAYDYDVIHSDITQYVPHYEMDIHDYAGIDLFDFASFSAHKFNGPKGVGALFVNRSFSRHDLHKHITTFMHGGGQESGQRSGTENVIGIVGMGAAAEWTMNHYDNGMTYDTVQEFRDIIENCLPVGTQINFESGIPVYSVYIPGVNNETLAMACSMRGVYFSTSSACHGNDSEPSLVLMNMGLPKERVMNTIRLSPSINMHPDVLASACGIIADVADSLRKIA